MGSEKPIAALVEIGRDMPVIPRTTWESARNAYLSRVRPWAEERLGRMSRGEKHPVRDFLFEYYSFRPAHLMRWTPGLGLTLANATCDDVLWAEFEASDLGARGLSLPVTAFPKHRLPYLRWSVQYLEATLRREPSFACSGLHEWAMVYRDPNVRHPYVSFRLSRSETDDVVESQPLRCSHYDAFRFFTSDSRPRNRWELTRTATTDHDQPGCLHANMDLYRFAYKIAPFCPSHLLADAFELALGAREIDMRASPYDLSAYGLTPVKIETSEGRAEYAELQRGVYRGAQPLRERMLDIYRELLAERARYG